ncbi:hypothetical protein PVK06_024197 [Gossypium arboreum]|uniref:Uncharacterized protein n=1 Tax=Gossypium arboreum TaxID=29729 RepID=A0ABR0PD95_GOSAR|nr:hypothetical protein PVK06_024197 [Gossypium arboreum]
MEDNSIRPTTAHPTNTLLSQYRRRFGYNRKDIQLAKQGNLEGSRTRKVGGGTMIYSTSTQGGDVGLEPKERVLSRIQQKLMRETKNGRS